MSNPATPLGDYTSSQHQGGTQSGSVGIGNDSAWRALALAFTVTTVTLVLLFGAWRLCLKDCLLTLRAKRSKTTTELGFGQTPRRDPVGGGVTQYPPGVPG
ncbi:movement protein [Sporobolus striate mosaic virus 2]|uniref:Movement protein n=1 Tax=Sporobolus striate mosaic virus 2 TaxID=1302850 RepID=J7FGJ8_9GEMI|nr:movement protein [Sporobolus striate mosaic virus 2]AFN80717.1 movement protein [Sporobolus striate mosaic virus 2]